MLVAPLGSGSAGNAFYFESDGTSIVVDAGFGPREMRKRLEQVGRQIEHIRALVITHEHYDHIRGAESIARKYEIPIYLTQGTLDASTIDRAETKVVVFPNNSTFAIGELNVHARRTLHDAVDPACFVIESRDGTRVGIASDLGYVDAHVLQPLTGCDGLFFESNHDLDMLRLGTYPWPLKRRIMSRDRPTRLLARTGAQLELSIARQFEATGTFEITRRRPARPPVPPKHVQIPL